MGRRRELSLCACLTGTRGSGKTLTMTIFAFLKMAYEDKKVWSNYPIEGIAVFPDGSEKYCASIPLNMDSLYMFDKGIANGIVCIDEVNLWSDSRRSMSITNRLLDAILTLIRHRQLSFYFTVQNEMWLDNRVRYQIDTLIRCTDLAFKYPKLEFGNYIQLECKDMSGYNTGYPYDETFRVYTQTLQCGKKFWSCYNTEHEFDVLGTQATKYKITGATKNIVVGNEMVDYDIFEDEAPENPKKRWGI